MPTFDPSTPTIERTFADTALKVPAPFTEGHALTASEAAFLNGQVASVVGNGVAGAIRRGVSALVKAGNKKATAADLGWDIQAKFNDAYSAYTLGESNRAAKGTGGGSVLSTTINFLNAQDLKARIAAKGLKVGAFMKAPARDPSAFKSRYAEMLSENMTAKGDQFRAQAEAQLASIDTSTSDPLFDTEVQSEAA